MPDILNTFNQEESDQADRKKAIAAIRNMARRLRIRVAPGSETSSLEYINSSRSTNRALINRKSSKEIPESRPLGSLIMTAAKKIRLISHTMIKKVNIISPQENHTGSLKKSNPNTITKNNLTGLKEGLSV